MSELIEAFFRAHPKWAPIQYLTRFLDDVFGFWEGDIHQFEAFISSLNYWSTTEGWNIQFTISSFGSPQSSWTWKYIGIELAYPDLLEAGRCPRLPLPSSSHPSRICKSIPLGVAFRVRRDCSRRGFPNPEDVSKYIFAIENMNHTWQQQLFIQLRT